MTPHEVTHAYNVLEQSQGQAGAHAITSGLLRAALAQGTLQFAELTLRRYVDRIERGLSPQGTEGDSDAT